MNGLCTSPDSRFGKKQALDILRNHPHQDCCILEIQGSGAFQGLITQRKLYKLYIGRNT